MIQAGNVPILKFAAYSRNCNTGTCGRKYLAPVPSLADIQLFVNFGNSKPASFEIAVIDVYKPINNSVVTSTDYLIGWSGSYWYGIFRGIVTGPDYHAFLIALITPTQTFFSEQYCSSSDCGILTKISVCYPYNYNDEDLNGIYIGAPDPSKPIEGNAVLFYQHNFWTRQGEIYETSNKITFTGNYKKNFATSLIKNFEFRPELVPGWYKDYLLSVYFRGNILIDGTPAIVTDVNFEDVDVDYWKAYAVLGKEIKGGFGCSPYICSGPCAAVLGANGSTSVVPVPCVDVESAIGVTSLACEEWIQDGSSPGGYINYVGCDGTIYTTKPVILNGRIFIQSGTLTGLGAVNFTFVAFH